MQETLEKIARWCNMSLAFVLCALPLTFLAISSLVVILLSPLFAFISANGQKLNYPTESWWKLYKSGLIMSCTELLPIVVFYNHF